MIALFRKSTRFNITRTKFPSQIQSISLPRRSFNIGVQEIVSMVQSSLSGLHIYTGLPWWSTISFATVFVRFCTFPLIRMQILASRKLAITLPELSFLYQLLKLRLSETSLSRVGERLKIISIFIKGVNACLTVHNVSLTRIFALPVINITLFMTFVYSVRDMLVGAYKEQLEEGGILWFEDLTMKDRSFVLPLSAIGLSYLGVDIALSATYGRQIILFKDFIQSLLILSVPLVSFLPAGVFFYWIPSSMMGILQHLMLRNVTMQRLLRMPPLVKPK
eukprot:gene12713-26780_t